MIKNYARFYMKTGYIISLLNLFFILYPFYFQVRHKWISDLFREAVIHQISVMK